MKRLLVATDLRRGSLDALKRAIRLSSATGASLRLIHVLPAGAPADLCARARDAVDRLARETVAGQPSAVAPSISIRTPSGDAAQAILEEAEGFDADLILMGARGEPRFRDVIFGTTATHVARHGTRPILFVQNDADSPYRTLMIALGDLGTADRLFETACGIAPEAEIFAVHAFDPSLRQILAGQDELDRQVSGWEADLQQRIEKATAGRKRRISTKQHAVVETGEVLDVLMKEADALGPDLVAMGTRRETSFLGSYAVDTLFWCPHDLLIVPERGGVAVA